MLAGYGCLRSWARRTPNKKLSLSRKLQQLEREIDRTGGMSQLTDRNQVDTALSDRANCLQIYASASLKLETRTPERHARPHLVRVHIIEEDDVYPRKLHEFTDLL